MISIIVAIARNRAIGRDNRLLWHITEDMRYFRATTTGHPVVMGRKTWESLGRPLPGRDNVVVSRDPDYAAAGARVAGSLGEAVAFFPPGEEVFVIGGGEIYAQAVDVADRMYVTLVDEDYPGDTFFPQWDERRWNLASSRRFERGENFPHPFEFRIYDKIL